MRVLVALFSLLVAVPSFAAPASWAVVCTTPCVASDGTTQPVGTVLQKVWWDPATPWKLPANTQVVPDTGQAVYTPPPPPITVIASEDFFSRFTAAEQQAIMTAAQTNWQVNLWLARATAAGTMDVTSPSVTAGMAQLVSAGLITSSRSSQIVDLKQTSP